MKEQEERFGGELVREREEGGRGKQEGEVKENEK